MTTLRTVLLLLALPLSVFSQAAADWPSTDLQDYVDYRVPSRYSEYEDDAAAFRDAAYPQGVLFSTVTGSLYWYSEDKGTVTCLLPLNGKVTGLSMSADRSIYTFSYNGIPYLWRPGRLPGVVLEEIPGYSGSGTSTTFRLNAAGTMILVSTYYANEYEDYFQDELVDLKTLRVVRKFETGGFRPEFTPDGKGIAVGGFDYDDKTEEGHPSEYLEAQTFEGLVLKHLMVYSDDSRKDEQTRYLISYYHRKTPDWYKDRAAPESPGQLDSWAALSLPDVPPYENTSAHRADDDGEFRESLYDEYYPKTFEISRVRSDNTVWRHQYVLYNERSGPWVWLDIKGQRLLILLARADGGSTDYHLPTYRIVLRTLDWATGERVGSDVNLGGSEIRGLLDWVPNDFVAVSTVDGRLEYSFKTGTITTGNGKVAFRGRSVTAAYPSMTGSVTYNMSGKSYTMARFPGQFGAIVDVAVRDDLKLVAALDEGGQLSVRRLADGEVVFQTKFSEGRLADFPVEFTADDLKPVFALPAASKTYRTQAFQYFPKK